MKNGINRFKNALSGEVLKELNWRIAVLLAYFGAEAIICLALSSIVHQNLGAAVFWTFWQGETSYIIWRYFFGLTPVEYLPLALSTGTLRLTMFWLIIFRGKSPLVHLKAVRAFTGLGNYQRVAKELGTGTVRQYLLLLLLGLLPAGWGPAFIYLRKRRIALGLTVVLLGNIGKFIVWVSILHMFSWQGSVLYIAILLSALGILFFPKLIEWFSGLVG